MNHIDDEKREEVAVVDSDESDELDEEDEELGEDEEIDADGMVLDEIEDFEEDTTGELATVEEELSQKEQNARSLDIRRAIERRMDQKRLDEDLDYLEPDAEE